MIIGTPSDWTNGASELLRQFLGSTVGQQFLAHLAVGRPSLLDNFDLTGNALRSQQVVGYEKCLNAILTLAEPVPDKKEQTSAETYPDLDDDKAWPGQAS